jgi:hypothetical protein
MITAQIPENKSAKKIDNIEFIKTLPNSKTTSKKFASFLMVIIFIAFLFFKVAFLSNSVLFKPKKPIVKPENKAEKIINTKIIK